jgi:hypothetical protein
MDSNNVILFPKENKNIKKLISIDEINHNVEQMSLFHIQETIGSLVPIIFTQLDIAGFCPSDEEIEEDIKNGAFLVEALRSMLCKHYGIYHPFQKLADNIFKEQPNEEGFLGIVDEIALDLREDEEKE